VAKLLHPLEIKDLYVKGFIQLCNLISQGLLLLAMSFFADSFSFAFKFED